MNIKSLFCKHDYKLKAKRKSMTYCTDYLYFNNSCEILNSVNYEDIKIKKRWNK